MSTTIRPYEPQDAPALRQCVVALQEYERVIDSRLRPGDLIADAYCDYLHGRCKEARGQILVADQNGEVAGFVCVLAEEKFTGLDDPPGSYALVTDLAVLDPFRRQGIGRLLLDAAESYARNAEATELRIGVLSRNAAARAFYLSKKFEPHLEILAKSLVDPL
jgi:ribosomal protein S18 acetylase RimI-like enzyme